MNHHTARVASRCPPAAEAGRAGDGRGARLARAARTALHIGISYRTSTLYTGYTTLYTGHTTLYPGYTTLYTGYTTLYDIQVWCPRAAEPGEQNHTSIS